MQIPVKTLESGFSMPVYGLGTWSMGGKSVPDLSRDTDEIRAIRTALAEGITHIDTAEIYGRGHAEELVGEAIQGYDRNKLFLVTKVYLENMSYDGVLTACQASLKRMRTDYLDLYLLHRYPDIPLKETMKGLDRLMENGLIRNIGVSNFTTERIEEAQSYTKNKIVAVQNHYNLQIRESEKKGVLKYCQENDIMFIAWRPLQKGMILDENSLLKEITEKYKKTPAQIALNWLIFQKNVVTLSKTTNITHLKENLGAIGWEMDGVDVEKLRKDFPNQEDISDTVLL